MNKNKKMYTAGFLCLMALTVATSAFQKLAQTAPSTELTPSTQSAQEQNRQVPEHIPYRILFHQVYVLNQEANKAEAQGKHGSAASFRSWFKLDAELSDAQARILNEVAAACENDVKQVDKKAKVILDARRAHYPDGKLMPGQEPLPPSEELKVLQQERNTTILQCRDRLRAALGEQEFARFQRFVERRVMPTITPTSPEQLQPAEGQRQ